MPYKNICFQRVLFTIAVLIDNAHFLKGGINATFFYTKRELRVGDK